MSEQAVRTQIRLLLKEQSDQDLQFAIPATSFGHITALQNQTVPLLGQVVVSFFRCPNF